MTNRLFLLAAAQITRGAKLTTVFKNIAMQGMPFETSGTRDVYVWMVMDFQMDVPEAGADIDAWANEQPIDVVRAALTKVAEIDAGGKRGREIERMRQRIDADYARLTQTDKAVAIAQAAQIMGIA
ncbi:hypothetical protein CcrColossus_gp347 [Caulobacter phage CcrColossus]|uniref:Uncharacterized protein n=1 Tax=Caulobacter phage CcrColossus TaxID=1211640 RepID=K4K6L6_9CAUD|nr:hypothetical protein CcrColossus_gp347 [Caulobacter phage CcrColossus]AFU88217.1 hypothetical protein CcrColossus_gp347 [Caulobacter phage CcrColossus]